ncbi:hypothetical protein [Kamptonema sp. UHCC 0994]|uniref:hypothetical protein n=1 Tax=Kamptonema sp. UHCC 0994 TaxID=3031329 RepID=UPI0023B9EED7|nr:hypothetical protein [Kamptonema sp. UHCC 0994]MDF0553185.1 hypothetical protein [Kamptonema sp. UHCC 0994]
MMSQIAQAQQATATAQPPKLIYNNRIEAQAELVDEQADYVYQILMDSLHPKTGQIAPEYRDYCLAMLCSLNTAVVGLYELLGGEQR